MDSAEVMIGICGRYQLTQFAPVLLRMENVKHHSQQSTRHFEMPRIAQ